VSDTSPSSTSSPALYLSNWRDLVAIWENGKLSQTDFSLVGPGIRELHYLGGPTPGWSVNHLVDFTAFYRDETKHVPYTQVGNVSCEGWFESGAQAGVITSNYVGFPEAAAPPRCTISRSYAAVPEHPFLIVRNTFVNTSDAPVTLNVLDQAHLSNVATGDGSRNVHAWHDAERNALFADMTASGQPVLVLGTFQAVDGWQVGDDDNHTPGQPTSSGWHSFDHDGTLPNNTDLQAGNVDLACHKRVDLAPGATGQVDYYLAVGGNQNAAQAAADDARSQTGSYWLDQTAARYRDWLSNGGRGRELSFGDRGLDLHFERSLIFLKNAQNPALGTFPATTNPYAYRYKTWVRDGSIAAIALDAAGHPAEADKYWRWMATAQGVDGTWKTTYSAWDGSYLSFVEPEYDSVGSFLFGVYRHYLVSGDTAFLNDLWPAVRRSADWLLTNISNANGLGAADYSIWEETIPGLQHNSWTQAWYVAGLWAAQALAEIRGETELVDWYAGGPASIQTALNRPSSWQPPGSWNPAGYYNRGINPDNSLAPLKDSSSDLLIALGVVDADSPRAASHISTIESALTHDEYGLARYPQDDYYNTAPWSPAGDEALSPEPVWPAMSMWAAVFEKLSGKSEQALARLRWFVSTSGKGYMPHGEAVSWITHAPILSSMSEPMTASAFMLAALMQADQYDLRVVPPTSNAGAYKTIAVGSPSASPTQWSNVPYFPAQQGVTATPQAAIKRVYVTNDTDNLYVRIDNVAGSLPAFGAEPKFAVRVYSGDFAHGALPWTSLGADGQPIHRFVHYMVERRSDEDVFRHWNLVGPKWTNDSVVLNVIPPQWDPATGRVEVCIPLGAISSSPPALGGNWGNLVIVLTRHDPTSDTWTDNGRAALHYRLTGPGDSWIHGNIETL